MPSENNARGPKASPLRRKPSMSKWKSADEFELVTGSAQRKKPDRKTTSRLTRKASLKNKGSFKKKVKNMSAPNLTEVIAANPELKKKAASEVEARVKAKEELKKKTAGKILVKKPSPKQLRNTWTSPLKPDSVPFGYGKKSRATPKTQFRKTNKVAPTLSESIHKKNKGTKKEVVPKEVAKKKEGDWDKVYADILSPQSGRHKFVAKQDLATANKIFSPKKKVRKPPPKPAPLPLIPPDDDDDSFEKAKDDDVSRSGSTVASKVSVKSMVSAYGKKAPVSSQSSVSSFKSKPPLLSGQQDQHRGLRPVVEDESEPVRDVPRSVTPPADENQTKGKSAVAPRKEDLDDFVDYGSEGDDDDDDEESTEKGEEIKINVPPAVEDESEKTENRRKFRSKSADDVNKSTQLVLEFALPKELGERDDGTPGVEVPVELQTDDEISSVGSWPSIESNDSYDTKMNKMMQRWVGLDDDDDEDERTMYDNDVNLEDNVLDHIVLAAPDLEEAMIQFEKMTGITPYPVGPLQGLGAKTAHVGLDGNRYVEILAPDEENPGPLGDELGALQPGTLIPYHYSIRSSEVSRLIEGYVYDVLGWDPDHIAMVQALADESIRQWDLLTMYGHDVGGCAPCYVKWKDPSHHPTAKIELKATLTSCTVRAPENHDVHKLITGVEGLTIEFGHPMLECVLSTPKGSLTFSADNPRGLVFPGYDDDDHISDMPDLLPVSGDVDSDWADVGSDSETSSSIGKIR